MKEEYIIDWVQDELRKWHGEVAKKKRWVEDAHEDVKKAQNMLKGFKYQLEAAEAVLQHLQAIAVACGVSPKSEVAEPW